MLCLSALFVANLKHKLHSDNYLFSNDVSLKYKTLLYEIGLKLLSACTRI